MKADRLLAANVSALLHGRGQKQTELAQWCHHSDVWVSQFLQGVRMWQLEDLDRVADFFGIATYQLFQPGISSLTERRRQDRRHVAERRIGHAKRMMGALANVIDEAHPRRRRHVAAEHQDRKRS